jgi:virginiamycin B lyase
MPRWPLLSGVVVAVLALAPSAHAFVYWANNNSIGRANLNGGGVSQSFMTAAGSGLAVDAGHLYWSGAAAIGRANLDGSSPNPTFITGLSSPQGVAVDAEHVYWADFVTTRVGRTNIDGSGTPEPNFIAGDNGVRGVAVGAANVYWTNLQDNSSIGRADLNGSSPDNAFIADASLPVAVAVGGGHLYWANQGSNSIGRADLDGTNSNQSFVTGANNPEGVAVDGGHVYWTNQGNGTIGRATLNGSGVNQSFITGAISPRGIAVDGLSVPSCQPTAASTGHAEAVALILPCTSGGGKRTFSIATQPAHGELSGLNAATGRLTYTPDTGFAGTDSFRFKVRNPGAVSNTATATIRVAEPSNEPSNEFTIGEARRNKKKGTAELTVEVPGPGGLALGGNKVKGATARAEAAGEATLPVKARGKARRKLRRKGKAKVTADVTFAPIGGEPRTQTRSVKLVKK